MKLNVNFVSLHLNAAQMEGLEALIKAVIRHDISFDVALKTVSDFIDTNQGSIEIIDHCTFTARCQSSAFQCQYLNSKWSYIEL